MFFAAACALSVLWGSRTAILASAVALIAVVSPMLGLATAVLLGIWSVVRRSRARVAHGGDDALLADLTVLGLSAGLTFPAAATAAAGTVDGESADRMLHALRFRQTTDTDPEAEPPLMVVAGRALATGAPLIPAVSAFAAKLRDEQRSRQLAAARRLPVKLLFPLALLILPGFLILTIGPALLGSLERLGL
jgi:tight adherence protein C